MVRTEALFATALVALTGASVFAGTTPNAKRPSTQGHPSFVRFNLAGGRLADEANYFKYDPKAGYYLVASGDCDGASINLLLTPDPKPFGFDPQLQKAKRVSLPRLRTGNGVNIGETAQQVRRKLGRAPHFSSYDAKKKQRVYEYNAPLGRDWSYQGLYTFRNERLWAIHYNYNRNGACEG